MSEAGSAFSGWKCQPRRWISSKGTLLSIAIASSTWPEAQAPSCGGAGATGGLLATSPVGRASARHGARARASRRSTAADRARSAARRPGGGTGASAVEPLGPAAPAASPPIRGATAPSRRRSPGTRATPRVARKAIELSCTRRSSCAISESWWGPRRCAVKVGRDQSVGRRSAVSRSPAAGGARVWHRGDASRGSRSGLGGAHRGAQRAQQQPGRAGDEGHGQDPVGPCAPATAHGRAPSGRRAAGPRTRSSATHARTRATGRP